MKKVLLTLGVVAIVVASVPLFAAYEAHVINVTAHIENALSVTPKEITFGTVFPQEHLNEFVVVTFSDSFCAEDQTRVGNIDYKIVQKPKCECIYDPIKEPEGFDINCNGEQYAPVGYATHECPEFYHVMHSLCEYLSKTPDTFDVANDTGVPAFHDISEIATGRIEKFGLDQSDFWTIDLAVPCFEGHCAQDWDEFVTGINPQANPDDFILPAALEHEMFGCDLWFEVTGISAPGTTLDDACVAAGGTVSTASCCEQTSDFPNTCSIGACGCAPEYSHEVKVCDCGPSACFDGSTCVTLD